MSNEGSTDGEPQANPEVTAPRMAQSSPDAAAQPERSAIEFPPTRWTWVLEAAEGDEAKAQQAMAELCDHYRSVIQGYFRMRCRDLHAAEDLAGAFVLHLLEKNRFRRFVRREHMRFRNYLSRALKHFFLDHPPEPPSDPMEHHPEAAGDDSAIEKHLDSQLALVAHQRAMSALEESYRKHGKAARAERLRPFILEDPEADEYSRVAADLGLTINALYQAVFRLRNDYYERFRAEVTQTVGRRTEELDQELRYLMALVPSALADQGESR